MLDPANKPEAAATLKSGTVVLKGDHRAWYELEALTGQPMEVYLQNLSDSRLTRWYELVWALTATHRKHTGSKATYLDLVEDLPDGEEEWGAVKAAVLRVLERSFLGNKIWGMAKQLLQILLDLEKASTPTLDQPEPTGTPDTTSLAPSSDSTIPPSGSSAGVI